MHTQRHYRQGLAEETVPGVDFALEAFEIFCMSGTGRESRPDKPGFYCSEGEHRSQLHQYVDACV